MTSEPQTFLWAELEGFRGFRDCQRIELDASVVILTGPNGTGKTSFFDALQWLLLGSLERLEPWRPRKNTEHIANVFHGDEPASVRAQLRFGQQVVELRRQGRHDAGLLEWADESGVVRGADAETRLSEALSPRTADPANLRRELMTSALLQQDVVREVLEDKAADRYEQLASLLGLDAVRAFELAARRRAGQLEAAGKAAREALSGIDREHRTASQRLATLVSQQEGLPDITAVRTELAERLVQSAPDVRLEGELPATASEALLLQTRISQLGDELAGLQTEMAALQAEAGERQTVSDADVDAADQSRQQAVTDLEAATARLTEIDARLAQAHARSEALASLALAAMPLLGETCPICEQEIVKGDVERHLAELIERGGAELPALETARNEASAVAVAAQDRRTEAEAASQGLATQRAAFEQIARRRDALDQTLGSFVDRLSAAGVGLLSASPLESFDAEQLARVVDELRIVWRTVGDLANTLRSLTTGEQLAAAEAEVQRVASSLEATRARATIASTREEEARSLQRAATRAATAAAESRFQLLAPLVGDIFSRLDPHPVFKNLDFSLRVYRERSEATAVVRDPESGIEADPLVVFSSSQVNVAALSYFLAIGWAAGKDAMPFVLLDDPLQSLDDVNALGFADLCRHVRRQRQLIASTHDPRLASLLERKLAPRSEDERTRIVEFSAWTRRGPVLNQRIVPQQASEGNLRLVTHLDAA